MSAAASAMAVRSEPPRPSVVISPAGGLPLESGDDDHVAGIEQAVRFLGRDVLDLRFGVDAVGDDARLGAGQRHRRHADGLQRHGGQRDGRLLAGREEHVHLALGRRRGDLPGQRDEAVGDAAHRRHDDDNLVATGAALGHATRDILDPLGISDRGAAVFLDDERHGWACSLYFRVSSSAAGNRGSISTGTPVETIQRGLDRRSDDAEALAERLGLVVVARRLHRHDLGRQRRHAGFDLVVIHREGAVGAHDESALVQQVVQLNGDPAAVRLVDAESDRPERGGQERGVNLPFERLVDHAFVNQVLQGPETGDVGFRFFEIARRLLHRLPHGGLTAAERNGMRPQAVHQLVHHDVREERVERQVASDRQARARPSRSARASSRTSRPGRSSASPAWRPSPW